MYVCMYVCIRIHLKQHKIDSVDDSWDKTRQSDIRWKHQEQRTLLVREKEGRF